MLFTWKSNILRRNKISWRNIYSAKITPEFCLDASEKTKRVESVGSNY